MKIIITVKDTNNIIGLKEDIAMRLEGVAYILRIDAADVAPKSEVAREIFEEIEALFPTDKKFTTISRVTIKQLKKKYTEEKR